MLESRRRLQSGTTTKSERVVRLDPKFALQRVREADKVDEAETCSDSKARTLETTGKEKLKTSEASHRVRIRQALHSSSASQKKTRELRWQLAVRILWNALPLPEIVAANFATQNITHFNLLEPGVFVIMRNNTREYLGEILDIYKKGLIDKDRV
ncbi:hypothetical protein BDN67DRAFT_712207 [Paxillus ammoniavirescens]|nr:hypothetical protein BDN67DRAFT_712207 [Paxillus ammoniavirescens]